MTSATPDATVEFFGTTTFRLRIRGLVIFLDTWLDRVGTLPHYLSIDDITEADYICVSHAHFDHLPGADRLAIRTGARVIGNPETIRILREASVPDEQLIMVAGGERVPLFSKQVWQDLANGKGVLPGFRPPGAPARPDPTLATMTVDVWPSLHALMSMGHHLEEFDMGSPQPDPPHEWKSTLDITYGMRYGLMRFSQILPSELLETPNMKSFIEYIEDPKNRFSHCDGGQLMYNFRYGNGTAHDQRAILWNAHLGAYDGILQTLQPKPDVAILGAGGEVNCNGRPYRGTAAEFVRHEVELLDQPEKIIWCLHDDSPIAPYRCNTRAAEELIETTTRSKILKLEPAKQYTLF